jgi:hypothetical protein
MNYEIIDCVSFDANLKLEKFECILLKDLKNRDIRIIKLGSLKEVNRELDYEKLSLILKNLGISDYKFRKGIGYKGIVQRLKFAYKYKKEIVFYRMKKVGNRFVEDKENILKVPFNELKYIYPLILSPEIKEDKLDWQHNYIIYPYRFGEKKPIDEEDFKKEAPKLFNYLKTYKKELLNQSSYNKRVQNNNKFYGVIRVGAYTYADYYLVIRDNTKLVAQVVEKIKTDWGEEKNPIFDNHISYLSPIDEENKNLSKKDMEKIKDILSWNETKVIVEGIFDSRSIGSRLPIKIERILDELSRINK